MLCKYAAQRQSCILGFQLGFRHMSLKELLEQAAGCAYIGWQGRRTKTWKIP